MSDETSTHQGKNEIIIVKRRGHGGDDGHHGGVWKIAYADFMTAMMAFFLVMWLVNAANEETKASVASYFNPIKLTDEKPSERGIKQNGSSQDGQATAPKSKTDGQETTDGTAGETGKQEKAQAGEAESFSEADLFENPYAVLSEIAMETGKQTNISKKGDGGAGMSGSATGASGGKAYRDPFDPDFYSKQIENDRSVADTTKTDKKGQGFPESFAPEGIYEVTGGAANGTGKEGELDATHDGKGGTGAPEPEKNTQKLAQAKKDAKQLLEQITKALGGDVGKLAQGIDVVPSEGGLLVSITDQLDFGMFNVGSAVPGRDLVVAMEKIGKILAERKGNIVIRGYTDARPFSSTDNDNWRLSSARAHSTLFMLVRGGVPEKRIVEISGFADRKLKDPKNPLSAVNRRIEILVQAEGS